MRSVANLVGYSCSCRVRRLVVDFSLLAVAGQVRRAGSRVVPDGVAVVVETFAVTLGGDRLDPVSHRPRAGVVDRVRVEGGVADSPCAHFLIGRGQALIPALPRGVGEDGLE